MSEKELVNTRRAKIVATLGPSSSDVETIKSMIKHGMNIARINMSHGNHEGHAQVIKNIRQASRESGWEVAVLLDLQGPKIRVDKLEEPLNLQSGEEWVIGESKLKDKYPQYKDHYIPTTYKDLVKDCREGARILFDDGLMVAKAISCEGDVFKIKIEIGGKLKSNKGINLPDISVSAPSFTEKDHEDLLFGLKQGIDFVALSFVRTAEDIMQVKTLLHRLRMTTPIIAKIEKPEAIENFDEILNVVHGIMVARGDMGVEIGNHLVPAVQKKLIKACNDAGKPVITATQMLESMIINSSPTRAEASDVANAIWDGTDAVMLSGETAAGAHPLLVLKTMSEIILEAEKTPRARPLLRNVDLASINLSTMVAASLISEKIKASRIIVVTSSGNSCLKISRFRPETRVMGVTDNIETVRKVCLYWGVTPYLVKGQKEHDWQEDQVLNNIVHDCRLLYMDKLVITRGDGSFFTKGGSNTVRVEIIKDGVGGKTPKDGLQQVKFKTGQIQLDTDICGSCQSCISVCPHKIWVIEDGKYNHTRIDVLKAPLCEFDMECVDVCQTGAIEIISNQK